ncbi:MAG: aldehyde dehydrogenase (NADP(+)) [Planctomycetota bacterium]
MDLHGRHLIAGETARAKEPGFKAIDPRTGTPLEPGYADADLAEIRKACEAAAAARNAVADADRETRALLLESIATGIEGLGDELLERAGKETGLPRPRLEGERGRTCNQLRMFARVVRAGQFLDIRIDHGDPSRTPAPKPDLRSMNVALGPVVVFGASNFPLAFSVAGGDTASALAAGCPVIVKAHPNHPGTSELVGRVITDVVRGSGLPAGTFSLVHGVSHTVGRALVQDPDVRAVAFTGSTTGGRALLGAANERPEPIPVFAEMGSTNPVFVLSKRLARDGTGIANRLSVSVTQGVGQFCTNPGLVVIERGPAADAFLAVLADALGEVPEGTMLHAGIRSGFESRLTAVKEAPGVEVIVEPGDVAGPCGARAALLAVPAQKWLETDTLRDEVFGPATIAIVCDDAAAMLAVARKLCGQLSVTVLGDPEDHAASVELRRVLADRTGRLLFEGMPTGVEVNDSIVHGGPFPATSDARFTSVGTRAIHRFLRPIAWQDCPARLLPPELRDGQNDRIPRLVDGRLLPPTDS